MKNNIIIGIFLSILVTIFGAAIVYVLRYQPLNMSVQDFINDILQSKEKKSAILSLALLANIPLIYYNQQRKNFKTIAGIAIVIGTICILIIQAKFF